jgi:hypothetical protein
VSHNTGAPLATYIIPTSVFTVFTEANKPREVRREKDHARETEGLLVLVLVQLG